MSSLWVSFNEKMYFGTYCILELLYSAGNFSTDFYVRPAHMKQEPYLSLDMVKEQFLAKERELGIVL